MKKKTYEYIDRKIGTDVVQIGTFMEGFKSVEDIKIGQKMLIPEYQGGTRDINSGHLVIGTIDKINEREGRVHSSDLSGWPLPEIVAILLED